MKQWMENWKTRQKGKLEQTDSPTSTGSPSFIDNQVLLQHAKRYGGKLLLREEFYLPANTFTQLLAQRVITPTPSIKKTPFSTICIRCQNKHPHLFAKINCSQCLHTHLYCRSCIQMGRVMECAMLYRWTGSAFPWPKHRQVCTWEGTLTTAQQSAAEKMEQSVKTNGTLLTWAVTGSGKTEMLFPSITTALQMGKRICIASPRADVVRELLPRLQQAFQKIPIQGLYGGSRDNDGTAQLIVATTHQLLRFQAAFDVLVIDEIDAFPFHQDPTLQFAAKRACKSDASLLYLTATPRRKQRQAMARGNLAYVFVPLRFHRHLLPIPIFQNCLSLQKDLRTTKIPNALIQWFRQRQIPTRQLLIFVPTIELARQLAPVFATFLVEEGWIKNKSKVTAVHAEDKNREEKVARFRKKQYMAMVTTTILERGVTFPALDVVVLDAGHQVFDEAALVQIAGRAGRSVLDPKGEVVFLHDGKTDSMVRARADMLKMNERATQLIQGGQK